MGWVSPTNFADLDNKWSNETKVFDDITGTFAYTSENDRWLELYRDVPPLLACNKIRVYAATYYLYGDGNWIDPEIEVKFRDWRGNWFWLYAGTIAKQQWVEIELLQAVFGRYELIDKVRIRWKNIGTGHWVDQGWLYEVDFNEPAVHSNPLVGGSLAGSGLVGKGLA